MIRDGQQQIDDPQELVQCCDDLYDALKQLQQQLTKILEVKRKLGTKADPEAISNLEQINTKLNTAISEIRELCSQAVALQTQELQQVNEIAMRVKATIDALLATGDWVKSLFLKAVADKFQTMLLTVQHLVQLAQQDEPSVAVHKTAKSRKTPPGYSRVFVLLYQVDETNLQSWYRTIKTLADYTVTRPVYKNETYAQECIRAKKDTEIERNGYIVVDIKNEDIYGEEYASVDNFHHNMYVLKENSVEIENILEFVHANKSYYAIHDNELILLDNL